MTIAAQDAERRYYSITRNGGLLHETRDRRTSGRERSFDRISECFCVFANPNVPRHHHDQRRWLAQQLGRSQVHCVQRADGLDGKRPAHAREDRVRHGNQVAATPKPAERAYGHPLLVACQPRGGPRAVNRPGGFNDRQCGRDSASAAADRLQRACVVLQQRRDQAAGLDVSNTSGFRGRRWSFGPMLRHGQRRSARWRSRPEAGYPASLPPGHPLQGAGGSLRKQRARRSGSEHPASLHLGGPEIPAWLESHGRAISGSLGNSLCCAAGGYSIMSEVGNRVASLIAHHDIDCDRGRSGFESRILRLL